MTCRSCRNKSRPLGRSTASTSTVTTTTTTVTDTPPVIKKSRMRAARSQSFTLRKSNGSVQTFGSELEAKAAQRRSGGEIL